MSGFDLELIVGHGSVPVLRYVVAVGGWGFTGPMQNSFKWMIYKIFFTLKKKLYNQCGAYHSDPLTK